jgi:hypothetical protein
VLPFCEKCNLYVCYIKNTIFCRLISPPVADGRTEIALMSAPRLTAAAEQFNAAVKALGFAARCRRAAPHQAGQAFTPINRNEGRHLRQHRQHRLRPRRKRPTSSTGRPIRSDICCRGRHRSVELVLTPEVASARRRHQCAGLRRRCGLAISISSRSSK